MKRLFIFLILLLNLSSYSWAIETKANLVHGTIGSNTIGSSETTDDTFTFVYGTNSNTFPTCTNTNFCKIAAWDASCGQNIRECANREYITLKDVTALTATIKSRNADTPNCTSCSFAQGAYFMVMPTAGTYSEFLTSVASDSDWIVHGNYPSACTNQFIRALGDTNTCASVGIADLASADFGGFTCNGSTCTVDSDSSHSSFLTASSSATFTNKTFDSSATGNSLKIYHASDCSSKTAQGEICQDSDDNKFYIGTGAGVIEKGATGATGPAPAGQIFLSAAGGWPSTTSGSATNTLNETATNKVNFWSLDFDPSSDENAEWSLVMPSDWNAGTITALFHWTANSTSTNSVVWCIQGGCFADNTAIDTAYGAAVCATADANGSSAYTMRITAATGNVTVANAAAGKLCQFRIYRDVSEDDLAVDAKLLGAMITFTRS